MGKMRNAHRGFVDRCPLGRWIYSWKGTIKIALVFDDMLYLEV
jgi:hypothetical protein